MFGDVGTQDAVVREKRSELLESSLSRFGNVEGFRCEEQFPLDRWFDDCTTRS